MTAALLLAGAVLLVAFGGLMAAIDAAFGVTSRSDIEEMGAEAVSYTHLTLPTSDLV